MQYSHSQYFNIPGFVCLLAHSNTFSKTIAYRDLTSTEESIQSSVAVTQKNNLYINGVVNTIPFEHHFEPVSCCLLMHDRLFTNSRSNKTDLVDHFSVHVKRSQRNLMLSGVKRYTDDHTKVKVTSVCMQQKHTQETLNKPKIERPKTYLCAYSNNNVWINSTPNKYISDYTLIMDCGFDGKYIPELPKYNYYIDLNDTAYDIEITFNLDFEDAEQNLTEATISIGF
jgi:hypothetical protein